MNIYIATLVRRTCKFFLLLFVAKEGLYLFLIYPGNASAQQDPHTRSEMARQIFDKHCLSSGERIIRTVANVEGIFLIKLRSSRNSDKQYEIDDPYGRDLFGQAYIESFLKETYDVNVLSTISVSKPLRRDLPAGYEFVEANDPSDGMRYRYTARTEEPGKTNPHFLKGYFRSVASRVVSKSPLPRYGVTFDDISTPQDRKYWIAGSSLKVIDLQKNEVIAERIGYMYDPAQGSKAGSRSPWLEAAAFACPSFGPFPASHHQVAQTVRFTEKVLHPVKVE